MYLLDTNICIYILKKKPISVFEKFKSLKIGDIKVSSITVAELYFGAYNSQNVEQNVKVVNNFLLPFDIVDFDESSAINYAKIKADLRKKGQIIGELDMQIAGVALAKDLILVTNNEKEFRRIKNLKIENWV
ncbi:type II toxin-antitoxin system tRNA(fMet)-specific endonuclease VapC [Caminibacter pacificus]